MSVNNVMQMPNFQVHSANSWESADLGDDERKKKFLKLMGASKVNVSKNILCNQIFVVSSKCCQNQEAQKMWTGK